MGRTEYELADGIATIRLDDGKVNALSEAMLGEVSARLDQAEADGAVVVLTGREGIFSAGFDLKTEGEGWPPMLVAGARVMERLLSFPRPVVVACNGSAIAAGSFLLLSSDYRVGADVDLRVGLNEVAIGLTLPWFAIAIARHRMPRPWFDRCTVTGAMIGAEDGLRAGFLDEVVAAEELDERALAVARELAGINHDAHAATKVRIRQEALEGIRDGIARIEGDGHEW